MPNTFHFLNPEWFLALLPLAALLWGARRQGVADNAWQRVVDEQLLPYLLMEQSGSARWLPLALLATGWLLAVIALANPAWEQRPVPALRALDARVVVLDLSKSMEAADLKPSRLARARYKVADILNRSRDGQVGLVAFAGDAFVVAPLSDDADTLLGMLDALSPEVMPVRGSRPDLGLAKAGEVLTQGGAQGGEVILVSDDPGDQRALDAAKALVDQGRSLSVIGVGTVEGAPVPGARDPDGRPAIAKLDPAGLEALAKAGDGHYAGLTADEADLNLVLRAQAGRTDPQAEGKALEADQWEGVGPWIVLALLPLAALGFRRGWLVGALLTLTLTQGALTPTPAQANTWDDLWQRRDQQAAAALAAGEAERALSLAEQPEQRGTASYRLGDYPAAVEAFASTQSAAGDYNRGNALALAGQLQEAIDAYDAALAREPGMEDALYNKARVEALLKQQQEQKEQQQQQSGEEGKSDPQQDQQPPDGQDEQKPKEQGDESASEDQGQPGEQDKPEAQDQPQGQDESGAQQKPEQQQDQSEAQDQSGDSDPNQGEPPSEQQAQSGAPDQGEQGEQTDQAPAPAGEGRQDEETPQNDDAKARQAQAEQAEQAAEDYRAAAQQEAEQSAETPDAESPEPQTGAQAEADLSPEDREAQQAAEQWLRRIPDDPSGLLRRKFLYQYRLRNMQSGATTSGNPW